MGFWSTFVTLKSLKKMTELLIKSKKMREEMGYEAYKTVSNNFSIEKQIKILTLST